MSKFKICKDIYYIDGLSFIGYSKYFSISEIYDKEDFINHKMSVLIELIGEHNASDISGTNSNHNKGIRKIQKECEKEFGVLLTNTEIKSLLKSRTKNFFGFGKKKRYIKCPYTMDFILMTTIKLSAKNKKIKDKFNERFSDSLDEEIDQNCFSLLLDIFYAKIKQKLNIINSSIDNDGRKLYFENVEKKLKRLKVSLSSSFIGKCELIH